MVVAVQFFFGFVLFYFLHFELKQLYLFYFGFVFMSNALTTTLMATTIVEIANEILLIISADFWWSTWLISNIKPRIIHTTAWKTCKKTQKNINIYIVFFFNFLFFLFNEYLKRTWRHIEIETKQRSSTRNSKSSLCNRYFNCDAFTANNAKSKKPCVSDFFDAYTFKFRRLGWNSFEFKQIKKF